MPAAEVLLTQGNFLQPQTDEEEALEALPHLTFASHMTMTHPWPPKGFTCPITFLNSHSDYYLGSLICLDLVCFSCPNAFLTLFTIFL